MRAFFSREFMPTIHHSSFEAGAAVPDADDPLEFGFLEQSRNILVGVRASSSARSRRAGRSCSRACTSCRACAARPEGAVSVFVVLSIEDEDEHAQHFHYRDEGTERPLASYLDQFAEIRRLQGFIVDRAAREGVPVIENEDADARRGRSPSSSSTPRSAREARADERRIAGRRDRTPPCHCQSYLRATEHAALGAARWLGRADEGGAEEAAATGMR